MAALAAIGLSVAAMVWSLTRPIGLLDDAIQLTGAMFLRRGQVPNVDFYSVYPPLNAYLLAAAFNVFGESVATYRLLQTAAFALMLGAICFWARSLVRRHYWIVPLVVVAATARCGSLQSMTALTWSTLTFVLLAISRQHADRRWLPVAGLCLGALAMTRPNFALYLGAAWALDTALSVAREKSAAAWWLAKRELLWFVLPAIATLIGLVLIWGGPVQEIVRQTLVSAQAIKENVLAPVRLELTSASARNFLTSGLLALPLATFWLAIRARAHGEMRSAKGLLALGLAALVAVLALGIFQPVALPILVVVPIGSLIWARWRFSWLERAEWFALVLGALQLHYLLSRPDVSHFMALMPGVAVLLVYALARNDLRTRMGLLLLGATLYSPVIATNLLRVTLDAPRSLRQLSVLPSLMRSEDAVLFGSCGPACDAFRGEQGELAAAHYIQAHSQPTDHIFSGLQRHTAHAFVDGVTVLHNNDMLMYWLARRAAGTHFVMMFGGVSTGDEREAQIVHDFETRDVKWLVLWAGSSLLRSVPAEPGILDRYIRSHYEQLATFDDYQCWRRRTELPLTP